MHVITVKEKVNTSGQPIKYGKTLKINAGNLIGISTKSLYVRKGFLHGTLFLSQRGSGASGAGDICKLLEDNTIEVNSNLFGRLHTYAEKAKAIVK